MMKTKLLAAATLATALTAVPAMAQDVPHGTSVTPHANDGTSYPVHHRDSGFWPGDVAAGVVGGAIGTAGAIASAPFRAFDNSYVYDNSYAYYDENGGYPYNKKYSYRISRNDLSGPICAPGTFVRGEDGLLYPCQ